MKKNIIFLILISPFLLICLGGCGGKSDDQIKLDVGRVVREAANTFPTGFNDRDLTSFDAFFAPPGEQYGASETIDAAHQLMDAAAPGESFQLDKLEIQNVQLDEKREEAVVTYYAEISMWENENETFTAVVIQDIALQKIDGQWLITGGDTANVTPGMGSEGS